MKLVITNIALLNAGDAAILLATLDMLRDTFGPRLDVVVCDRNSTAGIKYYPHLDVRPTLHEEVENAVEGRWRRRLIGGCVLAAAWLCRVPGGTHAMRLLPRRLGDLVTVFAEADLVLSAGGTYFVPHYRTLPKVFDLLVAIALRRPLALFTQSLGPFDAKRDRLLGLALRRARLILVRDEQSRRHLRTLGVDDGRVAVCADGAFGLMPPEWRPRAATPANRRLRIAVSVRDWPHHGAGEGGMDRYLDAVAALTGHLVEHHKAEVTFLSSCQGMPEYWTDDADVADRVVDRLPIELRAAVTVDRDFRTPTALISRLSDFDIVVATRMHVAILALCARVPVLPIAYEFKTIELFDRLGYRDHVHPIEGITGDGLSRTVDELLLARVEIARDLDGRVAREARSARSAATRLRKAMKDAA